MGMYDVIYGRCPICTTTLEIQSKGGDCELKKYDASNVPANVADSIRGDCYECDKCGTLLEIKCNPIPRVSIEVAVFNSNKDDD